MRTRSGRAVPAAILALCAVGVGPRGGASAGDSDPLAGWSGARALEIAKELASDDMKGRKTGFEGGRIAEEYVANAFTNIGLSPMDPDGDYLESFPFGATEVTPPIGFAIDGEEVPYGTGFVDLLYTGSGTVEGEVVFAGYGISAPDRAWDDYGDLDVKGKVVLVIRGAPESREAEFGTERLIGWKTSAARDRGAAACLLVERDTPVPGTIQQPYFRADLPALWISSAAADRILKPRGRTIADLKRSRDGGDPGHSFATGAKARVEVHSRFEPQAVGRNALAGFPGTDPDLRNEIVLIGAHMDHIGVDPLGRTFNGADDNASGTATLLALAETLNANRWRPKRTVVLCGFAGEEQGLVGSRALVASHVFGAKRLVAMINLDMTGQGTTEVRVGGGEAYPSAWKRMVAAVPEPARSKLVPFRVQDNSDHWPFFERGIPAFFALSSGDHPNYHQVTDDVENLKPECMEAVGAVAGRMLIALADSSEPLGGPASLTELLLHEGPRVVEGPAASKALAAFFATPAGGKPDRAAFLDGGWTTVVAPLAEGGNGGLCEWTRLSRDVKARGADAQVVSSASDLVNAWKGGRVGVLPRLSCPTAARTLPAVLSTYAALGIRWVAPFDAASPPTEAQRDAILDAALEAKVLVDLTGLPDDALAPARARLKSAPATLRVGPVPGDAMAALRGRVGAETLILAAGAPPEGAWGTTSDDGAALEAGLAALSAGADLSDPKSPARARARAWLGGAFVDALRRLP